jgi:hypothetical protein
MGGSSEHYEIEDMKIIAPGQAGVAAFESYSYPPDPKVQVEFATSMGLVTLSVNVKDQAEFRDPLRVKELLKTVLSEMLAEVL